MTDSLENYEAIRAMALQLRGMRSGMEEYRSGRRSCDPEAPERLSVLRERYDLTLVRLAVLLGVEVPISPEVAEGSTRLDDEARSRLEQAVTALGIDIEPPPP
jgi:hypothetical protein